MATTVSSQDTEFEVELVRIKNEIENRFSKLIACLRERERELLKQLEEISTAHRKEKEKLQQSISEMEVMLKLTRENIHSENLKDLQETVVEKIREKRKEFDFQIDCKHVSLGWDESVIDIIRRLGVLFATGMDTKCGKPVCGYPDKVRPLVCSGTQGRGEGQFHNPWGVSIDYKSGNIYIADQWNQRVQVFDNNGKYMFKFPGKMAHPLYIAITNDRVIVSQFNAGCLLVFDLMGTFFGKIGSQGVGNVQFNSPFGMAVNQANGDICVCDHSNNRVQTLSKDFGYISQFSVQAPRDIKLTSQHILVLTGLKPFLFVFNYKHTQVLQDISISIGHYLEDPFGFCIDGMENFLISDYDRNMILIFSKDGILLHQIKEPSIKSPRGITIDKKGRIVFLSRKPCLLIF